MCMQVCKSLGILEKDYFGLRYLDKNGEYLWINLRNPLHEQLVPGNRLVMDMRVKYFIKPQKILQPVTRLVGHSHRNPPLLPPFPLQLVVLIGVMVPYCPIKINK